jgi:hypothetical protein
MRICYEKVGMSLLDAGVFKKGQCNYATTDIQAWRTPFTWKEIG